MGVGWLLGFTPVLLAVTAFAIVRGGAPCRPYWLAWCGLAATMIGDYFLAVKGAPLHSREFLLGVAGFSLAQLLWIVFFMRRHARWSRRVAAGLAFSLAILLGARVIPALRSAPLACALSLYALLSVVSVSYACGTHGASRAWRYGLCLLLFSDTMIAFAHVLRVPRVGPLVGATYVLSLLCIAFAVARCGRPPAAPGRRRYLRRAPVAAFAGGLASLALFGWAMWACPGEVYNPFRNMLSFLGRTRVRGVEFPLCHYLFTCSLALSAGVMAGFYPALSCFVRGARQKRWLLWGGTLNAAGLLTIAFVPENVHGLFHNVGCVAAVAGGAVALLLLTPAKNNPRVSGVSRWAWLAWCCALVGVFEAFLLAHRFKLLPFSPYVPTCQKLVILTFIAWIEYYAVLLYWRTRVPAPVRVARTDGREKA